MPYVASIGTYLPCWGAPPHRVAGGYKLVEAELTSVGGAPPVNPSGRLKVKGRPSGATGVAQCVELFAQLRGEAANHVDGARVALAHNIGGPTAVSAVTILEGSASGTG